MNLKSKRKDGRIAYQMALLYTEVYIKQLQVDIYLIIEPEK